MNNNPNQLLSKEDGEYRSIFNAFPDGVIINDLESGLVVEANPAAALMHKCARQELIGLQTTTLIHPDSRREFDECMRAFQADEEFDTRILHVCRDGSAFYAVWHGRALTYQGKPCLLNTFRDVSKRVHVEQLLSQSVDTRAHEQSTLLEISHTLASTLELQPGLILDQLRKIVEYAHGGLFALEDSELVTLAMRGVQ